MKLIRLLSKILFLFVRGLSAIYLISSLYTFMVLSLHKWSPNASNIPIRIYESEWGGQFTPRFDILIPFTQKPIFLGHNSIWGMGQIVIGMALYGFFFYLLSNIFNAFRKDRLFTQQAVEALMIFAKANFICPILFLIFLHFSPNYPVEEGEIAITFLHALLGVFALIQAAIFKEGYTLQQDHDLTI